MVLSMVNAFITVMKLDKLNSLSFNKRAIHIKKIRWRTKPPLKNSGLKNKCHRDKEIIKAIAI
mgnify:CR=1 FL=1